MSITDRNSLFTEMTVEESATVSGGNINLSAIVVRVVNGTFSQVTIAQTTLDDVAGTLPENWKDEIKAELAAAQ